VKRSNVLDYDGRIGSGIPSSTTAGRVRLELLDNLSIAGGYVSLMYKVTGREA
jgi:hypothetical protein